MLAERYIAQGDLQEALEVCERGFMVNPAYERGAVAYLSALQLAGDAKRAGEVYGRAVAEHPRSSPLRVAWARVLLDAGREYEARLRTREAVNLDPMNRDARALLATLGGMPPPSTRTTGCIELMRTDSTQEYAALSDAEVEPDEPEEGGTREYFNPPEDHPALVLAHKRRGADANFDFTPAPVLQREPAAPLPLDSLADFFEVPEAPPPQTPAPVRVPPKPPGGRPPPPPPPPPPPIESPAPMRSDLTGPAFPAIQPETRSQNLFPAVEQTPAPPPPPDLPTRRSPTAEVPALNAPARSAPPKKRRMWVWSLLTLLLVGGGGTSAVLIYRHHHRQKVSGAMRQEIARLKSGMPEATLGARNALCAAAGKEAKVRRLAAACAVAGAELVYGGKRELAAQVEDDIARARKRDPRDGWTSAAFTLLALAQDKRDTASKAAATLPEGGDWVVTLTRARALEREGKPQAAAKLLTPLTLTDKPALPVLVAAARLARLADRRGRAKELLDKAKAANPAHLGAALQRALFAVSQGEPPSEGEASALQKQAEASGVARWRADGALVGAWLLAQSKREKQASQVAARAITFAGDERPELGWWAGRWQLSPGGSAAEAAKLLIRWGPAYEAHLPQAVIVRARALLALSRPHAADALLQKADAKVANELGVLQVRVAEALDDRRRLQDLCPPTLAEATRVVACAEALLTAGDQRRIKRWRRRRRGAIGRYLAGLLSLARGDARRAVKRLSKARSPKVDESRRLAALGQAYSLAGTFSTSLEVLRQAIVASAGAVRPRVDLARALVAAGRDNEALEVLGQVVAARPSDARLLAEAGRAFVALGRLKQARELVERAAKVQPDAAAIHLLGGEVALLEGRLNGARKLFRRVLAKQPNRVEALVALGRIAAQRKRSRRAKRYFAAALRRRPKDPDVRQQLAMAYLHLRRWRDAYAQTTRAVELWEKRGQRRRAIDLRIAVGRKLRHGDRRARKRAQELFFKASTSADPPPIAFYELGLIHRAEGERARAIWCFKQAIKRDKQMAEAYLQLGLTQRGKRRWRRRSRRNLEHYLKLAPKGRYAARVRKLLHK